MSGAKVGDRQHSGTFVGQDFRRDVDVHLQAHVTLTRVVDDDLKGYVNQGGKRDQASGAKQVATGPLVSAFLVDPIPKRLHRPLWFHGAPAVVVSDPKGGGEEEAGPGFQRDPGATRERTLRRGPSRSYQLHAGRGGDSQTRAEPRGEPDPDVRTIKVQVVRRSDWSKDTRLGVVEAGVPGSLPALPAGTAGVLLRASETRAQELVFVPGDRPIVAVNQAGRPEQGTLVYDIDPQTGRPDPDTAARVQSAWRVVLVKPTPCSEATASPVLSWQLGVTGQGRLSGHGFCTDAIGEELEEIEDEGQGDGTRTRERGGGGTRERGGGSSSSPGGSGGSGSAGGGSGDGVDDGQGDARKARCEAIQRELAQIGRRLAQIDQQIQALRRAPVAGVTGRSLAGATGRSNAIGRLNAEKGTLQVRRARLQRELAKCDLDGTRTREDAPVPAGGGIAHAVFSARLGGPLEVGGRGCPHQHGTDREGRPIYTGHVSTGTLYRGHSLDAPKEYQSIRWSDPGALPERTRVHHRPDPEDEHDWACGTAPGKWKWEAETAFRGRRDLVFPPRTSAAPPGGGGAGAAGPGGRGGGRGRRFGFGYSETLGGLPSGVMTASGATRISAQDYAAAVRQGRLTRDGFVREAAPQAGETAALRRAKLGGVDERHPTAGSGLRFAGGVLLVTRGTAAGEPDLSSGAAVPEETKRKTIDKAPAAVRLEPWTRNLQGRWGTEEAVRSVGQNQRGTVDGGFVVFPPDAELEDVLLGRLDATGGASSDRNGPAGRVRLAIPRGLARIEFAHPRRDQPDGELTGQGVGMEQGSGAQQLDWIGRASSGAEQGRGVHDLSALDATRTWDWPNKSGTVAMTSDVATATITPGDGISGDGSAGDPVTIDPDGVSDDGDAVAVSSDGLAVDGDLLELSSYAPSNFSPDTAGTDATRNSQLAALVQGIDDALASASGVPVDDTTLLVQDPSDNTKRAGLDAGDVPSGSDVRLKVPDADLESIIVSALDALQSVEHNGAVDGVVTEAFSVRAQPSGGYSSDGSGLSLTLKRGDNGELLGGIQAFLNDALGRYSDVAIVRRQGSTVVECGRFGNGTFGGLRLKDGLRLQESSPASTATESGYTTLAAEDSQGGLRFQQDGGAEQKVLGAEDGATDIAFDQNDGRRQDHYEKTTDAGFSGSTHQVNNVFTAGRFNRGPAVEVTTELNLSGSPTAVEVGDGTDQNRYGSLPVSGGLVAAGTKLDTEDATADPREFSIAAGGVTFTPVGGTSPSFNSGAVSLIAVEETVAHV